GADGGPSAAGAVGLQRTQPAQVVETDLYTVGRRDRGEAVSRTHGLDPAPGSRRGLDHGGDLGVVAWTHDLRRFETDGAGPVLPRHGSTVSRAGGLARGFEVALGVHWPAEIGRIVGVSAPRHRVDPYEALLALSFGGPERAEDVTPFLENVTRGRGVRPARLHEFEERYFDFGGRRPINAQTRALVASLAHQLGESGLSIPVYWGNRNWHP